MAKELKSVCGSREILVKTRTMVINNVRGARTQLVRVRTGSTPTFQERVREYAEANQISLPEHIGRQLALLDALKVQLKAADQQLVKLAGAHPVCRKLMTVPGVGPVTAVRFVDAIDDVTRFHNAHAVQSYLGLVPGESSSSDRKQHTGITKAGAMEVRRALIQAAWAAFRKAPKEPMVGWATQIAAWRACSSRSSRWPGSWPGSCSRCGATERPIVGPECGGRAGIEVAPQESPLSISGASCPTVVTAIRSVRPVGTTDEDHAGSECSAGPTDPVTAPRARIVDWDNLSPCTPPERRGPRLPRPPLHSRLGGAHEPRAARPRASTHARALVSPQNARPRPIVGPVSLRASTNVASIHEVRAPSRPRRSRRPRRGDSFAPMPTPRSKSKPQPRSKSQPKPKSKPQPRPRPAAAARAARSPSPAAPAEPASFTGFPRDAMGFWHELASEMSRDWFAANKARYEAQWAQPMQALLDAVAPRLAPAYRPLALSEPKVLRIHRDVRFSKDKAPYKTHIGAVVTVAGGKVGEGGNAAIYVHLGLGEEFVGVGCYTFDAEKLARWRKAVAGEPGAALQKIVDRLRKAGYVVGGHDDYKIVPRGFAPDHPRAELLKLRGLTGGFPAIPRGLLLKPGLADWLVEHGVAMAPLVTWLHHHVG